MTTTDRFDGVLAGTPIKAPCRCATTTAITLSGLQTVDGVALTEGQRCLVKNQASAVDNGIYLASASAWQRATDFDGIRDVLDGSLVYVAGGTANGEGMWAVSGTDPIIPGTSAITFALIEVNISTGEGTSVSVTSDITIDESHYGQMLSVNPTDGAIEITLPDPASTIRRGIFCKISIANGANAVSVSESVADTLRCNQPWASWSSPNNATVYLGPSTAGADEFFYNIINRGGTIWTIDGWCREAAGANTQILLASEAPTNITAADITDASANGRSLITAANYAAMRALLDLEAGTDFYSIAAANSAFLPQGEATLTPGETVSWAAGSLTATLVIDQNSTINISGALLDGALYVLQVTQDSTGGWVLTGGTGFADSTIEIVLTADAVTPPIVFASVGGALYQQNILLALEEGSFGVGTTRDASGNTDPIGQAADAYKTIVCSAAGGDLTLELADPAGVSEGYWQIIEAEISGGNFIAFSNTNGYAAKAIRSDREAPTSWDDSTTLFAGRNAALQEKALFTLRMINAGWIIYGPWRTSEGDDDQKITLAELASAAAWTVLGNNNGTAQAPQALPVASLANNATPASTDVVLSYKASDGSLQKIPLSAIISGAYVALTTAAVSGTTDSPATGTWREYANVGTVTVTLDGTMVDDGECVVRKLAGAGTINLTPDTGNSFTVNGTTATRVLTGSATIKRVGLDFVIKGDIADAKTEPAPVTFEDTVTFGDAVDFDGNQAQNAVIAGGSLADAFDAADQVVGKPELKDYAETSTSPTNAAGTVVLDLTTGNAFQHTLTADITTLTISNPPATGKLGSFVLKVVQDSTARTIAWPGSVQWAGGTAPTLSTASGAIDIFSFITWDAGTSWFGMVGGQAFAVPA